MSSGLTAATVVALVLSGCHAVLPLSGSGGDDAGPTDQIVERGRHDATFDSDGPSPADSWADQPDGVLPPDQAVGPAACVVTGAVVQQYPGAGGKQMVVCGYAQTFTQCNAWARCARPTWHVCTGSEYRARGGQSTAPTALLDPAWIAACVREAGVAGHKDRECLSCLTTTTAKADTVAQVCPSLNPFVESSEWVGMASTTTTTTPATDDPGACAFWSPKPAYLPLDHVLCCD